MVMKGESPQSFQRWPPAATPSFGRIFTKQPQKVNGVSAWARVQSLRRTAGESLTWTQAQQWAKKKKGCRHFSVGVEMQKLAVLTTFRVYDSIFKKTVKAEMLQLGQEMTQDQKEDFC